MTLSVNAKNYTGNNYGVNAVGYIGPSKTSSIKDDMSLKLAVPKPTSTFSGVARTESKLTRTVTLTGALTQSGDAILDINVTIPVGMASADIDTLLNDMGAFLSSATYKTHVKSQQISF